jgi:hypothetical protein
MHHAFFALLALHSATVIIVQWNSQTTLAVQIGDTLYTAEFSNRDLKPDTFEDGDRVQAEVKNGKLIVKLRNGKRVSARVHWVQRVLTHPLPENLSP